MKNGKKLKDLLSLSLCTAILLSLPALAANVTPNQSEEPPAPLAAPLDTIEGTSDGEEAVENIKELAPVRVWGKVTKLESGSLELKNDDENDPNRDIILHLSEETLYLDAVTGLPLSVDELKDGETLYAWIGPAMTMSLPPQSTAVVILGNIPQDFKLPNYYEITGVDQTAVVAIYPPVEQTEVNLPVAGGKTLKIPVSAEVKPYLTKNLVTLSDLTPGSRILAWSGNDGQIERVVLLPAVYQGYFMATKDGDIFIDGQKLSAKGKAAEAEEESVLLPVRAVAESIGYNVSWIKGQGAVVKNSAEEIVFSVLPGSKTAVIPAKADKSESDSWELRAPCVLENGITYLPAEDLAYLLNLYYY